jgi:hypothetical protein
VRRHASVPEMLDRRFGRWTVIALHSTDAKGNRVWTCRCDCGTLKEVWQTNLYSGMSVSCGCYARERASECNRKYNRPSKQIPEYNVWANLRARCQDRNDKRYACYGGRGISVCERWNTSFQAFLDDMGSRPSPKHSIDRIDNDGNYEPVNCRWATTAEQQSNKQTTHLVRCGDAIGTVTEWARICGMANATLTERLNRGWSTLDAILKPVDHRRGPRNRRTASPTSLGSGCPDA